MGACLLKLPPDQGSEKAPGLTVGFQVTGRISSGNLGVLVPGGQRVNAKHGFDLRSQETTWQLVRHGSRTIALQQATLRAERFRPIALP